MDYLGKFGSIFIGTLAVVLVFCASTVMAETITSPSYKIDGNMGGSFGGQTSSTSYKMSAIGGEAIVGNGASGSYMIDQQDAPTTPSMQLGVQPSGLVGYYPMDENTGTTTADASQYQNDGTLKSPAALTASGKLGGAIDTNGVDGSSSGSVSILDNANLPTGSQLTFEAWVNSRDTNTAGVRYIGNHWDPGDSESWRIGQANNDIDVSMSLAQSGGALTSFKTTGDAFNSINVWRHVAVVYDGSLAQADKVKVYIDGMRKSGTVTGTLPSTLQDSTAKLWLGSLNGSQSAFPGLMDHVKLFNRALSPAEIAAEYTAQNAGIATGLTLGTLTSGSTTSLVDAIVRTNVANYNLAVQQDHDLQSGGDTIPAVSGSIATPLTWSEGVTKGLGFTLTGAPSLDSKWNSGAKYAAVPGSATTFYGATGHVDGTVDVINLRLRLDINASQPIGAYSNNITYTGTMIP